jgi:penicillin amidase
MTMMRRIARALLMLALTLGTAAAMAWGLLGAARGPKADGTLAFAGLSAPVEVLRDDNGIPYVFAANTPDLIRAQGFVTAQARIFQMEAYRALALGRLSEAIGERGLASDREMRTIGLRRNAERHAKLLSPAARDFLGWYAQGLNAYIEGHAGDLPVELKLAGFHARPWSIDDMVTVLHFANWSQAANYKAELLMQQLIDQLGAQRAAELFPLNVNPGRRQPLAAVAALADAMWLGVGAEPPLAQVGGPAVPVAPIALGSNNWAIAPARSASGAAVVVNDPHLDARVLPGIWFPIGLFSPEVRAVGAALPATPGILVGRNAQVAFGVTNAYGDSQDLFVERIAPGQPDHYVDGDRVRPFETTVEVIRVKDDRAPGGMREEQLTVRRTVRGPIVSDKPLGPQGDRLLSLRTMTAEVPGGDIGIDRLLVARDAAEVDRAVQQMDVLYFNFVFADKAGAIGHRASGRVPVRRSGQGLYPKPVTGEDDWTGVIPPDRMPGQRSPARGWVASANHDNRPDGYAYDYSSFFSPSYRFERIGQVLQQGSGLTTADHRALMTDTVNMQVPRLLPAILAALKTVPEQADLVALLQAWDGRDRADQAAPLIYQHLYQRLAYETFVDELGEELAKAYLKNWYVWQGRFDMLVTTPQSRWFDDSRTPAVETLPDLIVRAARVVRADLAARHGSDPKAWRWGAEHRIRFDSPLRRTGFGRDFLGRAAQPFDGSGETVMRARFGFMGDHDVEFFGSMRLVADLADDQKVMAVVSGGVVERQFHPHQKNQLDPWFAGELLPWWFERSAIEAHARQRQTLVPAGP